MLYKNKLPNFDHNKGDDFPQEEWTKYKEKTGYLILWVWQYLQQMFDVMITTAGLVLKLSAPLLLLQIVHKMYDSK